MPEKRRNHPNKSTVKKARIQSGDLLSIVSRKNWVEVKSRVESNQITKAALAAAAQQGIIRGKNALSIIASWHQWGLIETLLNKDLITEEALAAAPQQGKHQGINALFFFIKHSLFSRFFKGYNILF